MTTYISALLIEVIKYCSNNDNPALAGLSEELTTFTQYIEESTLREPTNAELAGLSGVLLLAVERINKEENIDVVYHIEKTIEHFVSLAKEESNSNFEEYKENSKKVKSILTSIIEMASDDAEKKYGKREFSHYFPHVALAREALHILNKP